MVKNAPCALKRFVSGSAGFRWQKDLTERGAEVHLLSYETRIYRATDEALRQFRELKP